MFLENLCSPALLYLAFSATHIVIDIFRQSYNTAIMKTAIAFIFTTLLNLLCTRGMTKIAWFIVFIPFIMMTLMTAILLYVFGLSPFQGSLDAKVIIPGEPEENPAVTRGNGPEDPNQNQDDGSYSVNPLLQNENDNNVKSNDYFIKDPIGMDSNNNTPNNLKNNGNIINLE